MPPAALHIVGVDPGGTTGWARITVPRLSLYSDEPGEILELDYGEFTGDENDQAKALARKLREIQSLDYMVGPACVCEDFDVAETVTTDAEVLYSPIRIAAKLRYAEYRGELGDAHVVMQSRGQAKSTATDDRLKAWGLYDAHSGEHCRDATRHAITMIRRFSGRPELLATFWPYLDRMPLH
jgi:hypothetical protein